MDFGWWEQLTEQGVYFVTRLKKDIQYDILEERTPPQNSPIGGDQIIQLRSSLKRNYEMKLRVVTMWDEDKQEEIQFLTYHLKFGATTIARIYKERWQIEIFFESLTWCTPLDVMIFQGSIALNRPLVGALDSSVRRRVARCPRYAVSRVHPHRPALPATVSTESTAR